MSRNPKSNCVKEQKNIGTSTTCAVKIRSFEKSDAKSEQYSEARKTIGSKSRQSKSEMLR